MRRVLCGLGPALMMAAVLAVAALALAKVEPPLRGEDEIRFLGVRALSAPAGALFTRPLLLQNRDATLLDFPYRVEGGRPARVRVRVVGPDGRLLHDAEHNLPPSQRLDAPRTWFEVSFWGPLARFEPVPLTGGEGPGPASVSIQVAPGSPPVDLYFDPLDLLGRPTDYAAGQSPETVQDRRLAVRSFYGRPQPMIAQAPLIWSRLAALAPPWLAGPGPALLTALLLGLGAASAWALVREE